MNIFKEIEPYIGTIRNYGYIVTGLPSAIGSILLIIPVIYHKAIRAKAECLIIGALAFADFTNCLAYTLTGAYRILLADRINYNFNGFECTWMPWNILWNFFYVNCGTLLIVMAVDRVVVTRWTTWYIMNGAKLAKALIAFCYIIGICFGLSAVGDSYIYHRQPLNNTLCYQYHTISNYLYDLQMAMFGYCHISSIVVMVFAVGLYMRHNKRVYKLNKIIKNIINKVADAGHHNQINKMAARNQKEMTKRVIWSAVATIILVIIPVN